MITSHRRRYDVILAPDARWDHFFFFFFFLGGGGTSHILGVKNPLRRVNWNAALIEKGVASLERVSIHV